MPVEAGIQAADSPHSQAGGKQMRYFVVTRNERLIQAHLPLGAVPIMSPGRGPKGLIYPDP